MKSREQLSHSKRRKIAVHTIGEGVPRSEESAGLVLVDVVGKGSGVLPVSEADSLMRRDKD